MKQGLLYLLITLLLGCHNAGFWLYEKYGWKTFLPKSKSFKVVQLLLSPESAEGSLVTLRGSIQRVGDGASFWVIDDGSAQILVRTVPLADQRLAFALKDRVEVLGKLATEGDRGSIVLEAIAGRKI